MQIQQMQAQQLAESNRITEEDSIRKSNTAIEVALINAESSEGDGQIEDTSIDQEKLELQRRKQEDEKGIKDKQLQEAIRKAKRAEAQKQEEIAIKRKQANKPTSATKK